MTETHPPSPPTLFHLWRWIPEFWELSQKRLRPQVRTLGLALVVGVIAGIGAIAFYAACQFVLHYALEGAAGYSPHTPGGEPLLYQAVEQSFRPWMLLLIPVVGGIISGILIYTLAPEAEGHGTDAAIAAFHYRQGNIRLRVSFVKLFASAITIGTGGSGGREGPIALIGAGFGSYIGNLFHMRPAERRILMAAGVGAGIAAIFRAPLAGALFAAEILYRSADFESEVIVPAALASTAAYSTFGLAFGWKPLFTLSPEIVRTLSFTDPRQLIAYLILAVFLVALAMLYTRSFELLTNFFKRLALPPHVKPAIGALATGLIGVSLYYTFSENMQMLAVLSTGYGIIQDAMTSQSQGGAVLSFALILFLIALGKIITTGLTIGSGGSGGVFGPSMVIGGCGGGALGIVLHYYWPGFTPPPTSFVIVGMAGFFAAAGKTPLSTLVIVSEMIGDYNLLLPTLWVCMLAFLLSDEQSIYSSQIKSFSLSPAHQGDYVRDVLAGLQVKEFLPSQLEVQTLLPGDSLTKVIERLSNTAYTGLPVADEYGRYLGIVSLEEVHLASLSPALGSLVVAADLMRDDVPPLLHDDYLDRALELFVESDRLALAVVSNTPDQRVIGIVKRDDISSAYLQRVHGSVADEERRSETTNQV